MNTEKKLNMTMLCDFYELTMGNGYFQAGRKDQITYFDVFFRDVPDKGGFAVCAGLSQLIDYVQNLHFDEEDIAYLRSKNLFSEEFLNYLRDFHFSGDIWAIPEGTPIFPREPVVTVRAKAIEAQLIETFLLLTVNHQSQFAASTLSFNLLPGHSLSEATRAIEQTLSDIGMPKSVIGSFQGTAKTFKESLSNQPLLIALALVAVYIVLGMLYESFLHPITIISTLPSAGVGALLALLLARTEFSIIALIGVLLLIGIVKKNAIMMIDFAIVAEREDGLTPEKAIYQACSLRFRPIMMTTAAALFGALPLALGHGDGAELRIPLGISIVGGLILSQLLTLYTTPIVYLYMNRFQKKKLKKAESDEAENNA